ncbi:hypothetical protein IEQ34_001398 [Dendrobium chrysotoxum]|uniref:AMP-dependent synthetase/ligase domain-containing protein n=1 Tax=Dendrobium chrysotoxum TaxID=161865 RepID=A0AAV7HNZ4_DENCH|nr:hypothetical protein IEQ34_001398 [Dendrobium chrysotoxum]
MFYCNGWTFTWGIVIRGGTNIYIQPTSTEVMYKAIVDHGVSHPHVLCARHLQHSLRLSRSGGSQGKNQLCFRGAHQWSPYAIFSSKKGLRRPREQHWCASGEWSGTNYLQSNVQGRGSVCILSLTKVDVKETSGLTMESVLRDEKVIDEIMLGESSVMKGYFKNEKETVEAFWDGWFLTRDVGVM